MDKTRQEPEIEMAKDPEAKTICGYCGFYVTEDGGGCGHPLGERYSPKFHDPGCKGWAYYSGWQRRKPPNGKKERNK